MMKHLSFVGAAVLLLGAASCVSTQDKLNAVTAVNEAFKAAYERTLARIGTRTFAVTRPQAFAAMRSTLEELGFQTVEGDIEAGYLNARGSAPSPLTHDEWDKALESDLPFLRAIVSRHVGGMAASTVDFKPDAFDVVINVLTIDTPGGVEVSATMRLKDVKPLPPDFPRRDYPPPVATEAGLQKIWTTFERQLAHSRGRAY